MAFILAKEHELPGLLALAHRAGTSPWSHWDEDYPNMEILLEDLHHDALYKILHGDTVVGIISIAPAHSAPEEGFPPMAGRVCTLARFALEPAFQGKGYGASLFRQALAFARGLGYEGFQILVATGFLPGIHIYESCGFLNVGQVHLWGDDFYQYVLEDGNTKL